MRADIHNHAVPESVVEFYESEPAFGIEVVGERQLKGGPEGDYELEARFYDADTKVEDLEKHGLDTAVMSVDPPFFCYDVEPDKGTALAELINDGLRAMANAQPDHLQWMATVPLQAPERAASVLRDAKSDGCVGVEIGTSTGSRFLDDPFFEPFWAEAEALEIPVMLHPAYQHPHPGFDSFHLTNVIGNMLETTIAIERLIMSGTLDRHPGLTIVIVHSGGYFPWQQGRLRHARSVRSFKDSAPRDPADYIGRVRFDCLTHDRKALRFLIDQVGEENVLMGTDLPCDMATPEPWSELVAVAGEKVAARIAGPNIADLYGLTSPLKPGHASDA
jgi:aminocarboxymuconate-semialdehyde decarboxylase